MNKSVAFYTLGCKLNFSESSSIGRSFEEAGFEKVGFQDTPGVFVINTCSVTDNADKKCRKVVKEALKISPNAFVAIIGCYAQLKPTEIAEIPGVDVVLGASEKFNLLELIHDFNKREKAEVLAKDIKEANQFESAYSLNDRTRTFLKVQDGCNYNCTFCTIPLARGKSRSDTVHNIIAKAEEIAKTDVKEVVLTGVNIGDFGIVDGKRKEKLEDLVRALDEVEGINRFRISSIEPNLLTNEIIEFVARSHRFMPHFHLPLQSGNDKLLKLMRRRYERSLFQDRVETIKKVMPHACIGVDVIVGFPGETDEDFMDTYNFINELPVSYLHVFTYSERDNTPAVGYDGVVHGAKRAERSKMLRILSEKKKRSFYESQLDKTSIALFEGQSKNEEEIEGFTENYVKVTIPYDPVMVNELVPVKLKKITDQGNVKVIEMPVLAN